MNIWIRSAPLVLAVAGFGTIAPAAPRPNILIVFADDWGRHASAYAAADGPGGVNDIVRTPNFDRVAGEGVLFRHAFVSAPSCTPSRSALLSGQHFWRTGRGAILRGARWDPTIPAFPLLLREAGYPIGESYKVWSPGTPNDAPYGAGQYAREKAGWRFNNFSEMRTYGRPGPGCALSHRDVDRAQPAWLSQGMGYPVLFLLPAVRRKRSGQSCIAGVGRSVPTHR